MSGTGADLKAMRRLLYRHQWTNVDEWSRAVRALADLSDSEIEGLARTETTPAEADTSENGTRR